jgi:hypothetical protein
LPAEDLIENNAEALRIVPDDLWQRLQARFAGRSRTAPGSNGYQRRPGSDGRGVAPARAPAQC